MNDLGFWKNQLRDVGSPVLYHTYDDWLAAAAQRMVELHEKLIGEKRNSPMQDCDSRLRAVAGILRDSAIAPRIRSDRASILLDVADAIDRALSS